MPRPVLPSPHSWMVLPAESQGPSLLVPAVQMSWGQDFLAVAEEASLLVTDPQVLKGQSDWASWDSVFFGGDLVPVFSRDLSGAGSASHVAGGVHARMGPWHVESTPPAEPGVERAGVS